MGILGIKLLFSTTCHSQINDQIEVINKTLILLLRTVIQLFLKNQKDCLSFIEYDYNKSVYSTIEYSSFKVVYDFNLLTPFDLFPLLIDEKVRLDGRKAHVVKALNENMR